MREGMRRSARPYRSKLKPDSVPEIGVNPRTGRMMLVPTPLMLAAEIAETKPGTVRSIAEIRKALARKSGAEETCPLVSGIFFNLLAGAAEEEMAEGLPVTAPWWRVVLDRGKLSPKTPPGPSRQAELLRSEGVDVEERRGNLYIPAER